MTKTLRALLAITLCACLAAWSAACEKRPIGAATAPAEESSAPASPQTMPEEPPGEVVPQPADAQDDPAAPRALPRTGELAGLLKTEPVQVAPAAKASSLVQDDELARVLKGYQVRQVARCGYRLPTATARVLLVEMTTPADAFGAFSVLCPQAGCSIRPDGSLRSTTTIEKGVKVTACQGDALVVATCATDTPESRKDCERLVARTLFSVVAADPPLLAQAIREVQIAHCDFWIVRSADQLTRLDQPALRRLNARELNSRLGLTGDALLSVAAISQKPDSPVTLIWLAEYANPEQARSAAEQYRQATQPANNAVDRSTLVGNPAGRYLVGSWSADQEIARNMVRSLEQALAER